MLLPFGFQNVNGFSCPQSLISKQKKDFHKIHGTGVMMHVRIYKDAIGCEGVIAICLPKYH